MKALRLAAGFTLVLAFAGCGKSEKATPVTKSDSGSTVPATSLKAPDTASASSSSTQAAAPVMPQTTAPASVMPDVVGKNLDVALSDIKSAGFKDKPEYIGGGTFGVKVESLWKVCAQSPAAGEPLTAPRLTVERSCDGGASKSSSTTEPEEILTPVTNADLAAVLAERDNCSDTIAKFASTYQGRTIEFDGNIATMNSHGDKKTRYDILVFAGDYRSGTINDGPAFQFRDVNTLDLHLAGSNIPDSVGQGNNLHVKAQVKEYDSKSCLLFLAPVSTEVR